MTNMLKCAIFIMSIGSGFFIGNNQPQSRFEKLNRFSIDSRNGAFYYKKKTMGFIKGHIVTEEIRRKISEKKKGRKLSKEHAKKISEALKGRKFTDEWLRKIVKANTGKKRTFVYWLGKHHTEESKRKISNGMLGKKHPHKGHPQTEATRKKISEAHKGEKSYLWKGGITPLNEQIRHSMEFRSWREAVFARDNYTCQSKTHPLGLPKRGRKLHAHHIKSFAEYPELRFVVSNGITLCLNCHRELHAHLTWDRPKLQFNEAERFVVVEIEEVK